MASHHISRPAQGIMQDAGFQAQRPPKNTKEPTKSEEREEHDQ
jgi:hypothetical protein